jgi:Cu(I)/Ag(I) efflux system protein CusF
MKQLFPATMEEATLRLRSITGAATLLLALAVAPPAALAEKHDWVTGQVTKIDESAQKITIKHGPLKKFDMEDGMTMVFRAADPAMLKAVKPGDRIKFVPERIQGQFTVTRIEKAK